MRSCYLTVLTIGLILGAAETDAMGQTKATGIERFEALQHQGADGATLLYRLLKPADYRPAGERHPLLLFLHGAGERGADNKAQLKWGSEMMLTAADEHGCFVLVPQCPKQKKWAEVDGHRSTHKMPEEPSESMRLVMEVIAKLQKQNRIDADRLYVMGLSMGGYGTWDAIQRYPKLFAAAVPICGGGDETGADHIKAPVWAFHGDQDRVVPVDRSRNMIAALKAAGGKPRYTEYAGRGHDSWVPAFKDPEMLEWLFAQKRTAGE